MAGPKRLTTLIDAQTLVALGLVTAIVAWFARRSA